MTPTIRVVILVVQCIPRRDAPTRPQASVAGAAGATGLQLVRCMSRACPTRTDRRAHGREAVQVTQNGGARPHPLTCEDARPVVVLEAWETAAERLTGARLADQLQAIGDARSGAPRGFHGLAGRASAR